MIIVLTANNGFVSNNSNVPRSPALARSPPSRALPPKPPVTFPGFNSDISRVHVGAAKMIQMATSYISNARVIHS